MFNYGKALALRLLKEEDGPTAVEYAVMLAMIAIACISAILSSGEFQKSLWQDTANDMNNAMFK